MPNPYTGNPANGHTDTIILPADGDYNGVSLINALLEAQQDNHAFVRERIELGFNVPLPPVFLRNADDRFEWSFINTDTPVLLQTDVTDAGELWLPVQIPNGFAIKGIQASVHGGLTSHSGLPDTLPEVALYAVVGPGSTLVAIAQDDSADLPAYEQVHTFESLPVAWQSGPGQSFFFRVRGEAGTNAEAGALQIGSLGVRLGYDAF